LHNPKSDEQMMVSRNSAKVFWPKATISWLNLSFSEAFFALKNLNAIGLWINIEIKKSEPGSRSGGVAGIGNCTIRVKTIYNIEAENYLDSFMVTSFVA
jgi:hypothetical protein